MMSGLGIGPRGAAAKRAPSGYPHHTPAALEGQGGNRKDDHTQEGGNPAPGARVSDPPG